MNAPLGSPHLLEGKMLAMLWLRARMIHGKREVLAMAGEAVSLQAAALGISEIVKNIPDGRRKPRVAARIVGLYVGF